MHDLVLQTPPSADLITLAEVKAHLRLEPSDTGSDARIQDLIDEAVASLDGDAGLLGRALCAQTWTLHLDRFPCGAIRLPLPPLIWVEAIDYIDADGAAQTLASNLYQVLDGERAEVRPAYGQSWPQARATPRAVSITYECGWTPAGAPPVWPAKLNPARRAVKLMVEDAFDGPDPVRAKAIARDLALLRVPRV